MKKDIQDSEKIFNYKGRAKWTEQGFKEEYKQQREEIQEKGMKEIKFDFNEESQKSDSKQTETLNEKPKKKKAKGRKKRGIKSKIAQDLFGGVTLNV